jgi:ABC-type branched-subunit amino acid transport system ATPase component
MSDNLLEVHMMRKTFGGVIALADFSCVVHHGEILGIIGPNGAGKTTFFNIVTGFVPPESGKVFYKGTDITSIPPYRIARSGIRRTFQELRLIRQLSVIENVLLCFQNQLGEKIENVFVNMRRSRECEHTNCDAAMAILDKVGLLDMAETLAEDLSYGQQKLLSLVCCLAGGSDLLLLDEPVAGIAPDMTESILLLIRTLATNGRSVLLIEHNLDAIMQICDRVIFMNAGAKVSEGTPDEIRHDAKVIEAYLA